MRSGHSGTHRASRGTAEAWPRWRARGRRPSYAQVGALLVAVALLVTVVGALVSRTPSEPDDATTVSAEVAPSTPAPTHVPSRLSRARAVLERWDDARSAAWAAGDLRALGALYVPGSPAGAADLAMLRSWTQRGLRVSGLHQDVLALRVRSATPTRLVLLVTDREVGAIAHRGDQVQPLPADRPSRHLVTLLRDGGRWRVSTSLAA